MQVFNFTKLIKLQIQVFFCQHLNVSSKLNGFMEPNPGSLCNELTLQTNGRGGGQVVSVLTFYSDDRSQNPAESYSFSVKFVFEKNESKQKGSGLDPFSLKKTLETNDRDPAAFALGTNAL